MKTYVFFIKGYNALRTRWHLPIRFFSPFRLFWRTLASYILPGYLDKEYKDGGAITASEFLVDNNIDKRLIVSFTSFPDRIKNVWQVVECMKRQTIKPDKIILYLSKEQFNSYNDLPSKLTGRIDELFNIVLVDGDIRSYKKFYYSFQEFPDDLILLIDDDIYYPLDMVETLLKAYVENPDSVICRFGYLIRYNKDGSLAPYLTWPLCKIEGEFQDLLFGTGGGSLYQPSKLYSDVCNKNLFTKLCPIADDIWINAMTRLVNLRIIKLDCGGLLPIHNDKNTALYKENVLSGQNDIQLKAIEEYYRDILNKQIFSHQ